MDIDLKDIWAGKLSFIGPSNPLLTRLNNLNPDWGDNYPDKTLWDLLDNLIATIENQNYKINNLVRDLETTENKFQTLENELDDIRYKLQTLEGRIGS